MELDPELIIFVFPIVFGVVILILHVILAIGVHADAKVQIAQKRGLFIFKPGIWAFIILLTGLLGIVAYWVIHHSTLRPRNNDSDET